MGDDVIQLDFTPLQNTDQLIDVLLHWRLAKGELDTLVKNLSERKSIIWHSIDSYYRDYAASANGTDAEF